MLFWKKLPMSFYAPISGLTIFKTLTILLISLFWILVSVYFWQTNRIITEQCYDDLARTTEEACADIETCFINDRVNLRMLANVLSGQKSFKSKTSGSYLEMYDVYSMISSVAILTPENKVILKNGKTVNVKDKVDYGEEVLYGEHISSLQPSLIKKGDMVIRSYVPIRKKGKTVGLLFSEMTPKDIIGAWSPQLYDGGGSFAIVNRYSGDIIIDSSGKCTSINDFLDMDLTNSVLGGETGYRSADLSWQEEKTYISYKTMELEKWELMVMVNEDSLFAASRTVRRSLYLLLIGNCVIFLLYLLCMAIAYRYSVNRAEEKANIDVLTGLRNRNLYERFCGGLNDTAGVVCIYIDANGLHELNNSRGHLAGDQMLRFVADTLKVSFGAESVYRIGGDEFVVFCRNIPDDRISSAMTIVYREIERNQYHISAGLSKGGAGVNVKMLIKLAEEKMYDEKRRYYESRGLEMRNIKEEAKA